MKEEIKPSIKHFLVAQVLDSFNVFKNSKTYPTLYKEVQTCININLLLGIILEGFINEVGKFKLDNWTWNELEKSSTPLKFRLISGLKKGLEPNEQTMETIIKLHKIRNAIAHPKSLNFDQDVIIENNQGDIIKDPIEEWNLPDDINVYLGYSKLYRDHNFQITRKNAIRTLNIVLEISTLLDIQNDYDHIKADLKTLNKIEIPKRKNLK